MEMAFVDKWHHKLVWKVKTNWIDSWKWPFAILTEVTEDVVGHLTRYGRVGGCRCHVLPQLRRLVCLPLGLEDVISFSDFSAFTLAKYLSLMFSDTETLMSSLVGVATRSPGHQVTRPPPESKTSGSPSLLVSLLTTFDPSQLCMRWSCRTWRTLSWAFRLQGSLQSSWWRRCRHRSSWGRGHAGSTWSWCWCSTWWTSASWTVINSCRTFSWYSSPMCSAQTVLRAFMPRESRCNQQCQLRSLEESRWWWLPREPPSCCSRS